MQGVIELLKKKKKEKNGALLRKGMTDTEGHAILNDDGGKLGRISSRRMVYGQ
jgi:hypothetical protein